MFIRLLVVFLLLAVFTSCNKDDSASSNISKYKEIITGGNAKTWTLNKLFINEKESELTPGQARFTKTYKIDNTWIDSDGYSGTYIIPSIQRITETTLVPAQPDKIEYTIRSMENTKLELEYNFANSTYRLVFGL